VAVGGGVISQLCKYSSRRERELPRNCPPPFQSRSSRIDRSCRWLVRVRKLWVGIEDGPAAVLSWQLVGSTRIRRLCGYHDVFDALGMCLVPGAFQSDWQNVEAFVAYRRLFLPLSNRGKSTFFFSSEMRIVKKCPIPGGPQKLL